MRDNLLLIFRRLAPAVALLGCSSLAHGGILVGSASGNDHHADVLAVVNAYNSANDPDLPTDFDLFKKTDDDEAFVFNMANGFMFFYDAAGTMPLLTEAELTSTETAYFKYTGPETLLYYSVKGGTNFNVYTFMSGLNLLVSPPNNGGNVPEISHVSFWSGEPVPEPSSLLLLGAGALGAALMWRRR